MGALKDSLICNCSGCRACVACVVPEDVTMTPYLGHPVVPFDTVTLPRVKRRGLFNRFINWVLKQ
ncbi:hypothetical protein D305_gp12 [Pseudomonas phage UFV-P2]|uniref:Uncharacterized protein n=1 Tax=Pseudomonas phage UFV-P2 TaxID=1235661 RepID=M4T4K2_9CAUD|nr:hypothetical protein D305_gp12 [Pseudomonas phage UFV-P2]AGH62709.1 hypothetical protein [Pseudomonas phage UFV-P2]